MCKRDQLHAMNIEPNMFDIYTWVGIECARWPNLYPLTHWRESGWHGSTGKESSKISFLTTCFSSVIDYSVHFELLQFELLQFELLQFVFDH